MTAPRLDDSTGVPGLHSVRADRIRDTQPLNQPSDIAALAREAAADIDNGLVVEGCRRLVAIGGLAKACADILELGRRS